MNALLGDYGSAAGSSFWSETEFVVCKDTAATGDCSAMRDSTLDPNSLLSYWKASGTPLTSVPTTNTDDSINLKRECKSISPQVAALPMTLLKLQPSVLPRVNDRHVPLVPKSATDPIIEGSSVGIAPWMLHGGLDHSQSMSPSKQPLRRNSIAVGGSYYSSSLARESSDCHLINASLSLSLASEEEKENMPIAMVKVGGSKGLEQQSLAAKRTKPVVMEDSDVLSNLFEFIRVKVVKAKWTRDLQEFVSDQMLPATSFEHIRLQMDHANALLGARFIKYLSCTPARPCWAIVGDKVGAAFGNDIESKFSNLASRTNQVISIDVHTVYVLYDYDKEMISVKAVCGQVEDAGVANDFDNLPGGEDDYEENDFSITR